MYVCMSTRWSNPPDQYKEWGLPEDIYLTLKRQYDQHGIPVVGWEPDNNFLIEFKPPWGNGPPQYKWATKDWTKYVLLLAHARTHARTHAHVGCPFSCGIDPTSTSTTTCTCTCTCTGV